jgi:hypothetical protein
MPKEDPGERDRAQADKGSPRVDGLIDEMFHE